MTFSKWLLGSIVALLLPTAAMAQGADAQVGALVQQASSAADNIFTSVGQLLAPERQRELGTEGAAKVPEELQKQFDRLDDEVVAPLLKAGGISCAATEQALVVVLAVAAKTVHLGLEPRASVINAERQLSGNGGKCEEEAKAACKAKADPSILVNFWKKATRGRAITGTQVDNASYDPVLEKRAKRICTPKSYKIAGNAGPMKVSGTACSLEEPFTVKGGGGGMTVQFSYTPGNETGGQVSYTGGGSGVKMAGAGSYTVTLTDKGGTLKQTHSGKVLITGGGSATHTDTLTLTRMEPPC